MMNIFFTKYLCINLLLLIVSLTTTIAAKPCFKRHVRDDDPTYIVCVCTATYCDDVAPIGNLSIDEAAIYVSSQSGNRLDRHTTQWDNSVDGDMRSERSDTIQISIDPSRIYQSMLGFGGAFTDSTGININLLTASAARQNLMQSYFGDNGIQYTLGRVPMASCDFSTREYSYNDVDGDFNMTNFALADEDFLLKIPYIRQALQLTHGNLRLFSSPWSAPGWMKTNGHMKGGGTLKGFPDGRFYSSWATYFVKFFEAYSASNITFWATTIQNEPTTGVHTGWLWQTMYYTPEMERDFIKNTLGPALATSNIKLMGLDDNRNHATLWADVLFADADASRYLAGLAVHWYSDDVNYPASIAVNYSGAILTDIHNKYPDKFILSTEACDGFLDQQGTKLGAWDRAEHYAHDIIQDINNYVSGWVDWNMVLDMSGGPNWVNNVVDAPILVNESAQEFYKNPMFYALGHFSKFVRPDYIRIDMNIGGNNLMAANDIEGCAFKSVDGRQIVLVVRNMNDTDYNLKVHDITSVSNRSLNIPIDKRSILTIVWTKDAMPDN